MAAKTMGDRIREVRESRGLSASDLARLTNVTPTAVSNWENRGRKPRANAMAAICKVLGVTEAYIVSGKGGPAMVPPNVGVEKQIDALLEETAARIADLLHIASGRLKLRWTYN